jgi:hypothetical protein
MDSIEEKRWLISRIEQYIDSACAELEATRERTDAALKEGFSELRARRNGLFGAMALFATIASIMGTIEIGDQKLSG